MRGNETIPAGVTGLIQQLFLIPMRGNELNSLSLLLCPFTVPDPHEG